jgi:hypothetical protein
VVGRTHVDALTGEQITAANVVIVYANHIYTDFWEEMIGARGNWKLSIEIQIWGQGTALLFRDGQMYPGIWQREGRNDMLTFYLRRRHAAAAQAGQQLDAGGAAGTPRSTRSSCSRRAGVFV